MKKELVVNQFKECCLKIIEAKCKPDSPIMYAKVYAKSGLQLNTTNEIETQILYIQSNIQYWRGDIAKTVKLQLKEILNNLKD